MMQVALMYIILQYDTPVSEGQFDVFHHCFWPNFLASPISSQLFTFSSLDP